MKSIRVIRFPSKFLRRNGGVEAADIDPSSTRYTTYSEVLSVFKNLVPVPSALSAEDKYKLHIETLKKEMQDMSLSVIVASNRKSPDSSCTVWVEFDTRFYSYSEEPNWTGYSRRRSRRASTAQQGQGYPHHGRVLQLVSSHAMNLDAPV